MFMRIEIKRRRVRLTAVLAITDVVMNIFIFFFITFTLLGNPSEKRMTDLDMPFVVPDSEPVTPPLIIPKEAVEFEVTIKGENDLYFLGKQLEIEYLRRIGLRYLTQIIDDKVFYEDSEKAPAIIVAVNREIAYEYVVKVLDAVKSSHVKKISLTARAF